MAKKNQFHAQVIEKYLLSQLLMWFAITTLALSVLVSGRLLATLLDRINEHSFPADILFELWFYGTLKPLSLLMPFTAMLAVLLTFGFLYRDGEAYAIFGAGVSYRRVYATLIRFALPLSVFLLVFELLLFPIIERAYQDIKSEGRERMRASVVTAGQFLHPREQAVIFVNRLSGDKLHGIFAAEYNADSGAFAVETARSGELSDDNERRSIRLRDGARYTDAGEDGAYRRLLYQDHHIPLAIDRPSASRKLRLSAVDSLELWRIGTAAAYAELQMRLSIPLAALLLALIAFPLSWTPPRGNHQRGIVLGLLVFLAYYGGMIVARQAMARGAWPLLPGMLLVHGVIAAATPLLFYKDRLMAMALRRETP